MINELIRIDEQTAYPLAEKRFIQTCGFDLKTEKHQRMMKMGAKVREDGVAGINIQALVSFYEPEVFSDGVIHVNGQDITCNYFEQIPAECVEGVYFYMLSAGECYFSSEENIMDFLYADIWGTNYVDAGIEVLTDGLYPKGYGKTLCRAERISFRGIRTGLLRYAGHRDKEIFQDFGRKPDTGKGQGQRPDDSAEDLCGFIYSVEQERHQG